MKKILLIETSTVLCSVAVSIDGKVAAYRESSTPKAHASLTCVYVDEVLGELGLTVKDLDAVCVSKGPGSYTGLRVGVSTAKGLCFGAKVPLISAGTLDTLVAQAACEGLLPEGCTSVVPMIDARRMEVYTATFDPQGLQKTETEPMIIDSASFSDILEEGPVLFIGDAADKCRPVLTHPNAHFAQCFPKASAMAGIASRQLEAGRIEDVAYFEPFYLKEFVATTSKKKLF